MFQDKEHIMKELGLEPLVVLITYLYTKNRITELLNNRTVHLRSYYFQKKHFSS